MTPAEELKDFKTQIEDLRKKLGYIQPFDVKNLQDAKQLLGALSTELREMGGHLDYISKSFKDSVNEMSRQNVYLATAKKSLTGISDISRKLVDYRRGENTYTEKQLKDLKDKARVHFEELRIAERMGNLNDADLEATRDALKEAIEFNNQVDKTIKLQQEVNKEIGLLGVGLEGVGNLLGKLGFEGLSKPFSDAIEKTKQARLQYKLNQEAIADIGKEYARLGVHELEKKSELRKQLLLYKSQSDELKSQTNKYKNIAEAVKEQITLVNVVDYGIQKIITGFLEVNKASVELERLTGQNSQALAGANFEVATTVDVLKVAVELTQQLGINAQNAFSSDVLAGAAGLKNEMGLAADEAGGLAVMAQTTTGDINGMVDGIVASTSAFNKANRAAVSQGQILRDVATTSDSIKLSLGNNPAMIAKAASAARRLGLELKDVDSIASSLMNFEDSISAELEAELLTGKQLNLERARELALKNDLVGLGNEIFKNSVDINEFGKMNRIQQEAYAKALGLTKDQLARIAYNKAIEKHMTEEQAAAAAGVTAESMKQMDVQERISKAIDKLAQAFAPILDIVADIADVIGAIINPIAGIVGYIVKFLDTLGLIKPLLIAIGLYFMGGAIAKGIGSMVGGIRNLGQSLKDISKSDFFDKFKEIKDSYLGGLAPKVAEAPEKGGILDTVKGAVEDKAKGTVEDKVGGTGFKDSMKNLAEGLKQMGAQGVLKGIVNLALAGPALVLALPSTPFLLFMGKVDLKSLSSNFTALATGLSAMSGTLMGSLALAAFGVAGLIAIPSLIFLGGIALIGEAAAIGLGALATGLRALGVAAATGLPFAAIGLIAALGLAMIPFGIALASAAPAIEAFGTVVTSIFTGLATMVGAVADGFVKLMGAVTMDSIGPMLLLGPALFGIAAGLGAIALAGPMAIPALVAVTGLTAVADGVASLFGGGEEKIATGKEGEGNSSMAAVNEKLTTLINLVRDGQDIYLDANKVGRAQSLAVLKSQ